MMRSWSQAVCSAAATLMLVGTTACMAPLDDVVGTSDSNHTELPTMAASYALTIDSTVVTTHNEDGTESTLHTQMFALAQATQVGTEVTFTIQPCRLLLPPAGGFQGTVADSTIQLATPISVGAVWIPSDDGYQLHGDPFQVLLGVENVAPDEPLPTDGDDERVIDIDDDDAPGFSIHFSMMRVFSGLRASAALLGQPAGGG
ncbi:MAG: hypothetical protein JRI68_13710, partial [Deltaproteobacteria bacterium]|nr:hypothetical protein [Deltaproteobacteria bacterium]